MIILSHSNIDIIQGVIGYGNATEGITDWRISNTSNGIIGSTGIFNIFNSSSATANLSIIDNGNIGIGTTPITSSSKLEIIGNINISGNYRKNNRDVINDTSNYIFITSNLIIPRIISEIQNGSNYINRINNDLNTIFNNTSNYVNSTSNISNSVSNSQWTNVSSYLYYAPIVNGLPGIITSSPLATANGIIGTDRYMSFTYTTDNISGLVGQTQYTFTTTETLICDILMIGGGGSGGILDGGGGAGACIVAINQTLSTGTYNILVGNGGSSSNGNDSSISFNGIFRYLARGGGKGMDYNSSSVNSGGCGGGASRAQGIVKTGGTTLSTNIVNGSTASIGPSITSTYIVLGNIGGNTVTQQYYLENAGGGGIGAAGGNGNNAAGVGGSGLYQTTINTTPTTTTLNFRTYFMNNTTFGVLHTDNNYYIGGGGGGSASGITGVGSFGTGGIGGGGSGSIGVDNTGSGGSPGYRGGSGIVIIRYRKLQQSLTNVGIGITNPTSELYVYDDIINNTKVTIQNNYKEPIIISPNTTGYTVVETLESNKFYRTVTFNYFANYPQDPPNTALLAWYRFNGDGLDYNPYATKYNLIANSGTSTYPSDFFQGRRYINTAGGSLRTTALSLSSIAFSVAVWQRRKNSNRALFVAQGTVFTTNTTVLLGVEGNNTYMIAFHANDLVSPTYNDVDTWVHIVYVVLSNYNRRIYRNGVLIASDSNTTATNASGDLRFGANYGDNTNINIDFSDLRIYNNGLSAAEVAILYASYSNLVITDNYSVNFKSATTLLVNNVSKTVNGEYNVSMGHINSSMLPSSGQSDIPLASTAITALPIKYEYSYTAPSLPALITVAGATSSIIGTTERCISFTYTSDSSGLTGQTLYTFTPTEDLWCDILIVGGGGGGGKFGGGGGGGAVLFGTNLKLNRGNSVSVKVGNGGTGATTNTNGSNGFNSSVIINSNIYIANGGGGGGSRGTNQGAGSTGNNGGCGGGGSPSYYQTYQGFGGICDNNTYSNFQLFGNNGGIGRPDQSGASEPYLSSGGGGGAGSKGSDFSYTLGGGNGGRGKDFISYFGTNVGHFGYFGGGGGGQTWYNIGNRGYGNGGLGLYGGGGNGGFDGTLEYSADNGMSNTGGGGGGGKGDGTSSGTINGGNGGSGFVIIRYRKDNSQSSSIELISNTIIQKTEGLAEEIIVSGTTSATISGTLDRYILFTYTTTTAGLTGQTQYTFTPTETLDCDILVIGGGGGGGANGGGGGGGSGYVYFLNITLTPKAYTVRVGAGGSGTYGGNTNGYNSSFSANDSSLSYTSLGGGKGGSRNGGAAYYSTQGGCGGGGGGLSSSYGAAQAGIQSSTYGYGIGLNSATGFNNTGDGYGSAGSGGGGAGSNGLAASNYQGGIGGDGIANNITGTSIIYCAGGGGGPSSWTGNMGKSGSNNQGSYGSGSYGGQEGQGAPTGKNGVVIIRYRKIRNTTRSIYTNNYKVGNYNGDFKIISSEYSASNTIIDTEYMRITNGGNSIYNSTGSPQWSTISDRRIKENIEKASYDKCYESINKLELYRFNYINKLNNINKDIKQLGYIAQEVQDIFPKAVSSQQFYNDNLSISDMLSIDTTQINYSLYGTVKKLIEMYNDIEKQIDIFENILNIKNTITSNITLEDSLMSSNITFENSLMSSNITLEDSLMSSNITLEDSLMSSNITLEDSLMSSNQNF